MTRSRRTDGRRPLRAVHERLGPVAGMDLLLLAGAGVAVYTARKLSDPSDETADGRAVNKKAREVAG